MKDKYYDGWNTKEKYAVIDFDGVISQYDGWKGLYVYGDPVLYAKEAMLELKEWGFKIIIWTCRIDCQPMRDYLKKYGIPFDDINTHDHNPPDASCKPAAEVYVDDRSWYDVGRKFSWIRVMRRLRKLYQPRKDTHIDDAEAWSCPVERFLRWVDSFFH